MIMTIMTIICLYLYMVVYRYIYIYEYVAIKYIVSNNRIFTTINNIAEYN